MKPTAKPMSNQGVSRFQGEISVNNEGELVKACLDGDRSAIRRFTAQFEQLIYHISYRMLGHQQDAEDVTQDSLWRALKSLKTWDSTRPLKPWLVTITINRCKTALARRKTRPAATAVTVEPAVEQSHNAMMITEEIDQALAKIRGEYAECFRMYYLEERTCEELANHFGKPEGTIKTWLHRARKALKEELQQRGLFQ